MSHVKNKICIRATVSGKVQGVFFRDNAQRKAQTLSLSGWIKNLDNGDVELIACGERDPIMVLTDWLWQGPDLAEVSNVHWEEIPWEDHSAFSIKVG